MGGTPHPDGAWTEPLPPCLRALARRAAAFFPDGRLPDQALVNEYVEGSGIAAHADGPLYEPCAVIVSLESSARLDFFTDGDERVASVLLRPRSVVAFADAAYLSLKHGIAAARADTVDDRVCNGAAAGCAVGDVVARAPSRLSVTFRRLTRVARRLDGVDASLLHDEDRVELERRRRWWAKSIADDAPSFASPLLRLLGRGRLCVRVRVSDESSVVDGFRALFASRVAASPVRSTTTVQAQASYVAVAPCALPTHGGPWGPPSGWTELLVTLQSASTDFEVA